jgi:hypothetical protein
MQVPIHMFREHLTYFSNVKRIMFHTPELVTRWRVYSQQGSVGIGKVEVRASK